jgi:hypothetical protein
MLVKRPLPNPLCYEMVIVWSDEDDYYLVHLPDFREQSEGGQCSPYNYLKSKF